MSWVDSGGAEITGDSALTDFIAQEAYGFNIETDNFDYEGTHVIYYKAEIDDDLLTSVTYDFNLEIVNPCRTTTLDISPTYTIASTVSVGSPVDLEITV